MAVILLVRHGQASWDAVDYDQLSGLGIRQATSTGHALAELAPPSVVVSGSLERQRTTADLTARAAGWQAQPLVDRGWNEFDHLRVLAAHDVDPPDEDDESFAEWLHAALARWVDGNSDTDYDEPFAGFTSRVDVAMRRLREDIGPEETAVVFTSLGPICWIAAALLGGRPETWLSLAPTLVNASVTRVSLGPRGMQLSTFNEHTHLGPEMLTFR